MKRRDILVWIVWIALLCAGCLPQKTRRRPEPHRHRYVRVTECCGHGRVNGFSGWEDRPEEGQRKTADDAAPVNDPVKKTDGTLRKITGGTAEFTRSSEVTVLEWTADWCGPCRSLKPKMEAMAEEFAGAGVLFGSADYDTLKSEADGVTSLPRTRVYRNGVLTAEIAGDREDEIREAVRNAAGLRNQ